MRDAFAEPAVLAQSDCTLVAVCPDLGLDPERCVDDPTLFDVMMLGNLVVDVEVDPMALTSVGLTPGDWSNE